MTKATIRLEALTCPSCINKIEKSVSKLDGILDVAVMFNASKVKVSFDEMKTNKFQIEKTISNLGYQVIS